MSERDACVVLGLNCNQIRGQTHTNTGVGKQGGDIYGTITYTIGNSWDWVWPPP